MVKETGLSMLNLGLKTIEEVDATVIIEWLNTFEAMKLNKIINMNTVKPVRPYQRF
jgi:hypothetical protein